MNGLSENGIDRRIISPNIDLEEDLREQCTIDRLLHQLRNKFVHKARFNSEFAMSQGSSASEDRFCLVE